LRSIAALVLCGLMLSACTSTPERPDNQPLGLNPLLAELANALPGRYASLASGDGENEDALSLRVERESLLDPDRVAFMLTQSQPGQADRRFLLGLEPTVEQGRFEGRFAPIGRSGEISRHCRMSFQLREDGFSGQTQAEECRFGEGDQATGLIKEIAFDGRQLVIGDRLVQLPAGSAAAPDQVHAFFRVRHFDGWAGRLEGGDWRRASSYSLSSDGGYVEPTDAAGMSLGVGLELHRHRLPQGHILRLSAIDLESGVVIAESWADPDAEALGLALPDLQVGINRVD
jgi:hypothetical protein